MGYFPFFVNLTGMNGLIVGAGKVALHKLDRLDGCGAELTVVACEFDDRVISRYQESVRLVHRAFEDADVDGVTFVIAATSDTKLNEHIYRLCLERNILVNVVDDKERCTFIFPSVVKRGRLNIGISTEGASPRMTMLLGEKINETLPCNIEEQLDFLAGLRKTAAARIHDAGRRSLFLSYMAQLVFDENRIPEDEELEKILNNFINPIEIL